MTEPSEQNEGDVVGKHTYRNLEVAPAFACVARDGVRPGRELPRPARIAHRLGGIGAVAGATGGVGRAGGRAVHVILPGDVDDPTAPSGGNSYDRRACQGLTEAGWSVRETAVAGGWPWPGTAELRALSGALAAIPNDALVLLDGLVACAAPEIVVPESRRLRLVVLVHLPLGDETGLAPYEAAELDVRERKTLHSVTAIIATSSWSGRRIVEHHGIPADRVHVVAPGVDLAPPASGTVAGGQLLCVAAVTPRKGHDLLVRSLAAVADLGWDCTCVGGLGRATEYVTELRRLAEAYQLSDRVRLVGPRSGEELDAAYASADLVLLASHAETYGMVVTEALARGLPVLATAVGGVPEALGTTPDGSVPGLLVPPGDVAEFAGALRGWLAEPELRRRLRAAAQARRDTLVDWAATAGDLSALLDRIRTAPRQAAAGPSEPAEKPIAKAAQEPTEEPAERYSPEWLGLREPADAAARSEALLDPLRDRLSSVPRLVIRDLGCGTGSMGRWLAPRLPGRQHWVLQDRDADLLAHAAAGMVHTAADGAPVSVETRCADITSVTAADLAGTSLITASALLDLLTLAEADRLAEACVQARCPALLTLSVAGRVELTPADPLDATIAEAFDDHQRRYSDRGRLLGPDAANAVAESFTRRGAAVRRQDSPWRLGPAQAALIAEWLHGWVGAAVEQRPELADRARPYLDRRLAQAAAGELDVIVHHTDVLALPSWTAEAGA